MAQAIGDPEEMMNFARVLKAFAEQMKSGSAQLRTAKTRLGESWRDQENQKFAAEFDRTMVTLSQFIVLAEKQVPFLQKKAERLQDYLNQR